MILGADTSGTIADQVSLGNILTIGTMIVLVTVYILNMRTVSAALATRLEFIDKGMEVFREGMDEFRNDLKRINDVITNQALQNQRIQTIDDRMIAGGKRVDELATRLNQLIDMRRMGPDSHA